MIFIDLYNFGYLTISHNLGWTKDNPDYIILWCLRNTMYSLGFWSMILENISRTAYKL